MAATILLKELVDEILGALHLLHVLPIRVQLLSDLCSGRLLREETVGIFDALEHLRAAQVDTSLALHSAQPVDHALISLDLLSAPHELLGLKLSLVILLSLLQSLDLIIRLAVFSLERLRLPLELDYLPCDIRLLDFHVSYRVFWLATAAE